MHYVGIDLHKRYVTVCALNKSGEVVAEYRRLANTAEAVLGFLERLKGPVAVALEATLHWAWLHDLLSGAGYEVKVAHPQQVKLMDAQVKRPDREVREQVAVSDEARLLETVPGIGPYLALLIEAEIGTIERFRTSHELSSYAGLVPSTRSSGGKTAHGGVGPAGSSWLKWALVEATQVLKQVPGPVRFHYERLRPAKGKQKATVAAARKLCCYLYWMLREGWSYEEWLERHERLEVRPVQTLASVA